MLNGSQTFTQTFKLKKILIRSNCYFTDFGIQKNNSGEKRKHHEGAIKAKEIQMNKGVTKKEEGGEMHESYDRQSQKIEQSINKVQKNINKNNIRKYIK